MKTFVRLAVTMLTITALCQASLALADDYYWTSSSGQQTSLTGQEKVAGSGQSACNPCDKACCCSEGSCESCCPGTLLECDECSRWSVIGIGGFDAFKGISERDWPSNFGAVLGFNSAVMLAQDYNFGWQFGMTYGVYDFDGRDSGNDVSHSQQQTFVTTGFYHKADDCRRLSYGIVYDWMYNQEWGLYGTSPTLGQWRGQIEYALNCQNGLGMWGCIGDLYSNDLFQRQVPVLRTRPISQASVFWHHKFCSAPIAGCGSARPNAAASTKTRASATGRSAPTCRFRCPIGLPCTAMPATCIPAPPPAIPLLKKAVGTLAWASCGTSAATPETTPSTASATSPYLNVANNSTFLVDQGVP